MKTGRPRWAGLLGLAAFAAVARAEEPAVAWTLSSAVMQTRLSSPEAGLADGHPAETLTEARMAEAHARAKERLDVAAWRRAADLPLIVNTNQAVRC